MKTSIRCWRQTMRYRAMVSRLRALPTGELRALGIEPRQIRHLAFEVSRL